MGLYVYVGASGERHILARQVSVTKLELDASLRQFCYFIVMRTILIANPTSPQMYFLYLCHESLL